MSDDAKQLIILGGISAIQSRDVFAQARAVNLVIVLTDQLDNLERAPDIVMLADDVYPLDFEDAGACVAWVERYPQLDRVAGVFSFKEKAQPSIAAIVDRFGFRGPSSAVHGVITDKYRCRERLRAAGLRQPSSWHCESSAAVRDAVASGGGKGYGAILKPVTGYGSKDVFLVRNGPELTEILAVVQPSAQRPFVVETFVEGEEFSAEGLCVGGSPTVLSLTAKSIIGGGNFVESGHLAPAELPECIRRTALEAVEAAVGAVGLNFGLFHAELWIAPSGEVVMGEIHSRPGGDYITHLTQYVTGVAYYASVFAQLRCPDAKLVPLDAPQHGAAGIRYFLPRPGVVREISGFDRLPAMDGFVGAALRLAPGDVVKSVRHSFDRVGHVIATGAHAAEVRERLARMIDAVSIVTVAS